MMLTPVDTAEHAELQLAGTPSAAAGNRVRRENKRIPFLSTYCDGAPAST